MGLIALENMVFIAQHGMYEEEKMLGSEYRVSISIETNFNAAASGDDLSLTINYESLYMLISYEMQKEKESMEELAAAIMLSIREMFPTLRNAKLRLAKHHPPLDEEISNAYIEMYLNGRTLVGLDKLRIYGKHGYYEEETILGNYYIFNLEVELSEKVKIGVFNLNESVNYETLFLIAQYENETPSKLLEHLGMRILNNTVGHYHCIKRAKVSICKENPPLKGKVGGSLIVIEQDYEKECERCGQTFSCFKNTSCWCKAVNVPPYSLQTLMAQYDGCICKNCLEEYAIK
jgi:7,8-dihydroneopterin aldolase/epimerase/oxygenase